MQAIPGIVQGIRDPLGTILQMLTGVLSHFIATARADLDSVLARYLFSTVDPTAAGIRPLTANPAIAHLNGSLSLVADVLVGGFWCTRRCGAFSSTRAARAMPSTSSSPASWRHW